MSVFLIKLTLILEVRIDVYFVFKNNVCQVDCILIIVSPYTEYKKIRTIFLISVFIFHVYLQQKNKLETELERMKREMKELQDQLTTATAPLEKWYVFCPIALTLYKLY